MPLNAVAAQIGSTRSANIVGVSRLKAQFALDR
jgi:hypothetical protein